jgi:hypothetical protein
MTMDNEPIDLEVLFKKFKATGKPQTFYFHIEGNSCILGPRYITERSINNRREFSYQRPELGSLGKRMTSILDPGRRGLKVWDNYFKAWAWGLKNKMKVESILTLEKDK